MYREYKGGSQETIQGITVNIPPVGYVWNPLTSQLEYRGVLSRSKSKKEQYWERMRLPDDWQQKRNAEIDQQEIDPEHVDPELEAIRQQAWDRRLCGLWFQNNGTPTYITGTYAYYLDWIYISNTQNDGYPDYRDSDRKFFYFLEYCVQDPRSLGCIYVTRRREGKTAKSVAFVLDLTTRSKEKFAGIQSKTDKDAAETVFEKGVVKAFKKLPDFFVPQYDLNSTLKKDIRFIDTPVRGINKNKEKRRKFINKIPLDGGINFRPSNETAYDGSILHRYVADEIFKTENVNIRERHNVVAYCCIDTDGKYIGKMLCTSTVEEMEGSTDMYIDFWNDSNQNERNAVTGRTTTGLYRYFLPSDEARERDKYGFCDKEKNREAIIANRASVQNNQSEYNSLIRKEPLTIEEAFRFTTKQSIFDVALLNNRLDFLSWQKPEDIYTTGDLVWLDGERDTEVQFSPRQNGKFRVLNSLLKSKYRFNDIEEMGNTKYPRNTIDFVVGIDPFSHDGTEDPRASKGAGYGYRKYDPNNEETSGMFMVEYCYRTPITKIFFEDMVMLCHWLGCKAMIENNKIGLVHYFKDRGYFNFLYKIKGRKEPGLPSSPQMKQRLAELTDDYHHDSIEKVWFQDLIKDWLAFDIKNTQKYDRTMAAGWTLVGNEAIKMKVEKPEKQVTELFHSYAVYG